MLTSTRRSISYPNTDRSDRPDIPAHIANLVTALELDVVYVQGTAAQRAAAVHMAGIIWRETDTGNFYWDTGAAWVALGTAASINLTGLYSAQPAANTVPAGTHYFATDTLGTWRSDGAAWTLVDQRPLGLPPASLSTLGGLYSGQLISLQVDATNGINWLFRYNASSASSYKWEFLGGPPMYSEVAASESTNATSYAALTTPGPSITLPRAGDYDIFVEYETGASGVAMAGVYMSYDIGATTAVDADAAVASVPATANVWTGNRTRRKTGLTSGIAITAKYRVGSANSVPFLKRIMQITPVRIS